MEPGRIAADCSSGVDQVLFAVAGVDPDYFHFIYLSGRRCHDFGQGLFYIYRGSGLFSLDCPGFFVHAGLDRKLLMLQSYLLNYISDFTGQQPGDINILHHDPFLGSHHVALHPVQPGADQG
ncbi:hypothetical protein SDC9_190811 [bioreactor metagenome]|uniref:Uncharacterized protein n=1 Tax=bioreactor metagenome TaxID=1076179 RepID=A0A645HXL9_9ZZZZ